MEFVSFMLNHKGMMGVSVIGLLDARPLNVLFVFYIIGLFSNFVGKCVSKGLRLIRMRRMTS